ncbi:bifunctional phosphopantothenoylcysteine decarboxylase/phosphopantothenate--cysteine ligase CoaBC [Desulfurella sp.]|uniref:bifunctional phosphopantothenoylcysteine decarboxylase/phosphopantothenate--cysteine ligase CoaBC n=1 Tax=Desulfurella sp. TaxID=1962857 RepID=UPI003D13AD8D
MFEGKKILIGVSASVAIYKACELIRSLRKEGYEVKVAMTKEAQGFISSILFESLSSNKVYTDVLQENSFLGISHIELANWADAIVIVPATANIIAKIAYGIADCPVSLATLASDKPKIIAPAMNTKMYENTATQENIALLKKRGFIFVEPTVGELACNSVGRGHIASVEEIQDCIESVFFEKSLKGKTIITTASATREEIDPVRFISNYSSGKMGFALAQMAFNMGAESILISGPSNLETPFGVNRINVKTALEMLNALDIQIQKSKQDTYVIMAAAVSDFKTKQTSNYKIKRQNKDTFILELVQNPDISKTLKEKYPHIKLIGFAAETNDLIENAKAKIDKKGLEFIVLNDVSRKDIGFGTINNEVTIILKDGKMKHLPFMTKKEIAYNILKLL